MRIRRLEPASDLPAVLVFVDELEAQSGIPPFGESKYVDLGGPLAGRGYVGEDGGIVAYLHMLWHEASRLWEMELAVEPGRVTDAHLEEMVGTAAAAVSGRLLWWTFGPTGGAEFAAERFPLTRRLHKLMGPLPPSVPRPDFPAGIRIAPFRLGYDEEAWLEVNNAAFAGHAENGGWDRRDILARQSRDWFDADGFRLAWAGDRLAGFCWTKRHTPEVGEIHVIGVHPDFQRQGLGRLIVVEAMYYLEGRGCGTGMLYVDDANSSAMDLYQSLGFEVERTDRCFGIPKGWPQEVQ